MKERQREALVNKVSELVSEASLRSGESPAEYVDTIDAVIWRLQIDRDAAKGSA